MDTIRVMRDGVEQYAENKLSPTYVQRFIAAQILKWRMAGIQIISESRYGMYRDALQQYYNNGGNVKNRLPSN